MKLLARNELDHVRIKHPLPWYDYGAIRISSGVNWSLTVLAMIFVTARFLVRRKVFGKWFADDWVMLFAMACQIAFAILEQVGDAYMIQYMDAIPTTPEGFTTLNQSEINFLNNTYSQSILYLYIMDSVGVAAAAFGRLAGVIMLIRVFDSVRWLRMYLYILTAIQFVLCILYWFAENFPVRPLNAIWDVTVIEYRQVLPPKLSSVVIHFLVALFAVTDLSFVVLPAIVAWDARMPKRRQVGLAIIALLSLLPTASAVIQIVSFNIDTDWLQIYCMSFAPIEQCFVIIIGSILPVLPIFRMDYPVIRFLRLCLLGQKHSTPAGREEKAPTPEDGFPPTIGQQRVRRNNRTMNTSYLFGEDEYQDQVEAATVQLEHRKASLKGSIATQTTTSAV